MGKSNMVSGIKIDILGILQDVDFIYFPEEKHYKAIAKNKDVLAIGNDFSGCLHQLVLNTLSQIEKEETEYWEKVHEG